MATTTHANIIEISLN